MKKIVLLILFSLFALGATAQKWAQMMQDPNANFYDIKREFEAYWKDRPYERGKGFKPFKRWAWFVEPRVYPSGNMANASRAKAYEEFQNYLQSNATARGIINSVISSTTSNWVPLGPFGSPVNGDAGRLQCVRFMPGNPTTIFVGTAAGGLWKSTDNGATWNTTTDQLATLGAADLAIDPSNTNIMYLATGDNDAGDTKSIGVMKSVDGGLTWSATGLSWATSLQRRIGKLLVNPLNTSEVTAATSVGVYRTLNSGVSWTLVQSGSFTDMEYRPGDTTTIYVAGGASLYKSTNGGASFSPKTYGAIGSIVRVAIAVTPADPNYLYVLGSKPDYSYGGVYLSTNSASTFSTMSTTPNILDWSTNGSGSGGQGWY
ncbi:MAG: WD40/YVTN/BNR-like repeat-containing protein, partial [Bacteroidia bacterium]